MIPRLFYERLDDFGIDFALVYTSLGLFYVSNPDEELRRAVARGGEPHERGNVRSRSRTG